MCLPISAGTESIGTRRRTRTSSLYYSFLLSFWRFFSVLVGKKKTTEGLIVALAAIVLIKQLYLFHTRDKVFSSPVGQVHLQFPLFHFLFTTFCTHPIPWHQSQRFISSPLLLSPPSLPSYSLSLYISLFLSLLLSSPLLPRFLTLVALPRSCSFVLFRFLPLPRPFQPLFFLQHNTKSSFSFYLALLSEKISKVSYHHARQQKRVFGNGDQTRP